ALNYDGGCTAYSLFHIPVEYSEDEYKCQIKSNSERAKLIQETSVIIWNKLFMAQKGNIKAVDMLLCELCNCNLPFSRKIFIRIGDFCQVAPVVPNAGKTATILESIKLSTIWNSFKVYNLQQPIANIEITACVIVHSTAIVQEICVQIWCINEKEPEYINIINKYYEALQYSLFFPHREIGWHIYWVNNKNSTRQKILQVDYYHYRIMTEPRFYLLGRLFNEYLVDMFSRADDERLQFIHKEQYRFRKGGQEEDESLSDEAELHPE
ncbi:7531_t:CDS:1, partial [Ambispora leptoticha]